MRINTHYFINRTAAIRYYRSQGEANPQQIVDNKIHEGLIEIGKPELKAGQKLGIDTVEGRYFIEE